MEISLKASVRGVIKEVRLRNAQPIMFCLERIMPSSEAA